LGDDEEMMPAMAVSFRVRFREHPDFSVVHRDDAQFFAQLPIESVSRRFGVSGVTADDVPDAGVVGSIIAATRKEHAIISIKNPARG
jgi:hypothetical protein